jgi:nicotinamide mononucleotide (NMN) deamidase PncC
MAMSNAAKFNQGGMPNQLAASVAGAIASGASQNANVQALTALTGAFGTTGNAIADVGGSFVQATLNNNFRALEDKVNAIIAALKT